MDDLFGGPAADLAKTRARGMTLGLAHLHAGDATVGDGPVEVLLAPRR